MRAKCAPNVRHVKVRCKSDLNLCETQMSANMYFSPLRYQSLYRITEHLVTIKLNQSGTTKTLVGGLLSLAAQCAKTEELVLLVKPKV